MARTADGRAFRILAILDDRRITSQDVIDQLFYLFLFKGIPEHIRSDNGTEFTAKAIRDRGVV